MQGAGSRDSPSHSVINFYHAATSAAPSSAGAPKPTATPNTNVGGEARLSALLHRLHDGLSWEGDAPSNSYQAPECVFQKLHLEPVMRIDASRPPSLVASRDRVRDASLGVEAEDDDDPSAITSRTVGGKPNISKKLERAMRRSDRSVPRGDGRAAEKPLQIIIPLNNERVRLADIRKGLKTEYATRYCEYLGVTPSPPNIASILRDMPLEHCRVRQVLHPGLGRGERRNHVAIEPMYGTSKKHERRGLSNVEPLELLSAMTGGDRVPNSPVPEEPNAPIGAVRSLPKFDAYKRQFVYPFNLRDRFEVVPHEPSKDALHPHQRGERDNQQPALPQKELTARRLRLQESLLNELRRQRKDGDGATRFLSAEDVSRLEAALLGGAAPNEEREVTEERPGAGGPSSKGTGLDPAVQREVDVTFAEFEFDEIRSLQQQFLNDFPFDVYCGSRFAHRQNHSQTDDEEKRTRASGTDTRAMVGRARAFLVGGDVTVFLGKLLRFLFSAYIAPHMTTARSGDALPANKDRLFVDVYTDLLSLLACPPNSAVGSGKTVLAFDIPLLILMTRVLVDSEFTSHWPQLMRTAAGLEIRTRMSFVLNALLDPTGMSSHLSRVESTPKALRVLHRKRSESHSHSLSRTTPLMQFIVGEGQSAEAKLLLREQGAVKSSELLELERQLSPMVRNRLLELLTRKLSS